MVKITSAVKFILFLGILVFCWMIGRYFQFDLESFRAPLSRYPAVFSWFVFIVLYISTTTFIWFGPKDVLRVLGALLFGGYLSGLLVWVAEMGNAVVMFQLSRLLGREFVEKTFRLKASLIDKVKKEKSVLEILVLRLIPFVPFRVMDIGYGLSSIRFLKYFLIIAPASLPRLLFFQLILSGIGARIFKGPQELTDYLLNTPSFLVWGGVYFLCVLILSGVLLWRKCRKESVA